MDKLNQCNQICTNLVGMFDTINVDYKVRNPNEQLFYKLLTIIGSTHGKFQSNGFKDIKKNFEKELMLFGFRTHEYSRIQYVPKDIQVVILGLGGLAYWDYI